MVPEKWHSGYLGSQPLCAHSDMVTIYQINGRFREGAPGHALQYLGILTGGWGCGTMVDARACSAWVLVPRMAQTNKQPLQMTVSLHLEKNQWEQKTRIEGKRCLVTPKIRSF